MSSNNDPRVTGLTLPWVLTIVFMILKLCKVINWKWIWVFAPVWLSLALAVVAGIIYIILYIWSKKK
ncbi:MAG: hypothetical protein IKQ22_00985 [Clostridia bacterium]|nr:hypothetical protein [Clostridia bacterium]